ncbi:restriction endonuclease subunit S [Latilactobacillus curvatus]|uniref:restriction endonuclease subunit S n=1 Tax=Latilactobacillus curvatus TaxID=28038 RepID=UPI0021A83D41|nr:restriction endonuclease subunit S [Latilactobacillus curvatus]MCT3358909.1 restriction endonuclease subunit S [Latilactobacillus curvatus]
MSIDWEQVEFQSKIKLIGGATPFKDNPEYWNGNIVWLSSQEIKNKYVSNGTYTITKKAIIDNKTRMVDAGTPLIVTRSGILAKRFPLSIPTIDVAINQDIKALLFDQSKLNVNFFVAELQSKEAYILKKIIKTGTTVQSVNLPDLNKLIISVVSDFKEQEKIGDFFQKLDHTIALQQRKLDLLTKLKQGYLQQLFPSKDKYLPRLRFKEFNGDWKQCTMGEIFTERTERSGEGELISVTINSGVVKASELDRKDNSSKNKSNYKKVEIGDIAYNSMRMWQGASGYSPYKGILSPAYTVITPKNEIDSEFFAYDFKRFNMIQVFKRNSQGLTSDTWNLKFPTLKSIKINVPHFDEQRRISNTFNQVDNMLLLQQTKIDQLNKLKQAYLQKLFP